MERISMAAVLGLLMFAFLFGYVAIFWVMRLPEWKRELWYINMELSRTEGFEKCLWKQRKRRLLLALLPFVKIKKN